MAYNNPATKLERAVRAYLIAQGTATLADCFVAKDSRTRVSPNRTIFCTDFTGKFPFSLEGTCQFQIQHHYEAFVQPDEPDINAQTVASDDYLGKTIDSMTQGDGQSFNLLANAITRAGRDLAVDYSAAGDSAAVKAQNALSAAQNADMLNFRMDWIKMGTPFLIRGKSDDTDNWVEMLNFVAFVSNAPN